MPFRIFSAGKKIPGKEARILKLELNENERLCKYFYEKGFDLSSLLSTKGDQTVFGVDVEGFQQDIMTSFAKTIHTFNEDFLIPKDVDIHVLRHPRYMPVKDHSHDFIEFVYIYQGDCIQHISGREVEAQEGDLFLLAPGVYHHISTFDDDSIVIYIMIRKSTFQSAFMSLLKQSDLLSAFFAHVIYGGNTYPYLLFITQNDPVLKDWIFSMYKEASGRDDYSDRMLNTQFEWMCLYLLRNHIGKMDLYGHGSRAIRIMELLGYINEHFCTITLSDLAAHFGYSTGHLCRLIKKATGMNFSELTRRIRLEKACELLSNSTISISLIAEGIGFCDSSNFYKAFKKQYGLPPAQYRKSKTRTSPSPSSS
jgi:AraC-like DNA-binding protein/mannose-6-phosphate isomerase-like protein (cupin superfamily)